MVLVSCMYVCRWKAFIPSTERNIYIWDNPSMLLLLLLLLNITSRFSRSILTPTLIPIGTFQLFPWSWESQTHRLTDISYEPLLSIDRCSSRSPLLFLWNSRQCNAGMLYINVAMLNSVCFSSYIFNDGNDAWLINSSGHILALSMCTDMQNYGLFLMRF